MAEFVKLSRSDCSTRFDKTRFDLTSKMNVMPIQLYKKSPRQLLLRYIKDKLEQQVRNDLQRRAEHCSLTLSLAPLEISMHLIPLLNESRVPIFAAFSPFCSLAKCGMSRSHVAAQSLSNGLLRLQDSDTKSGSGTIRACSPRAI